MIDIEAPVYVGPKCGQPCSGRNNPCTGGDGCHCVAKSTGINVHQSFCSKSFFALTSRRRRLASTSADSGDDTEIVLIEGSEPEPDQNGNAPTVNNVEFNDVGSIVSGTAACPCNCTYVSVACCTAAEDGIVHEPPNLNLGRLDPPQGSCCDLGSGEYVQMAAGEQQDVNGSCIVSRSG